MSRTAARWEAWKRAGAAVALSGALSPITFPAVPLAFRVEIALNADPAGDPADWLWLDITQWVRYQDGIQITRGRPDEAGTVDPGRARLRLDNRDGRFSRKNPLSPYYGLLSRNTPIRIGANPGDSVHYRFHGFVNEWPSRWSPGLIDSSVPIVCAGVLRRLSKAKALHSAMFRSMIGIAAGDYVPFAYWPMEDGSDATQFASAMAGGSPAARQADVTPAGYSGIAGSLPLPVLGTNSAIVASPPVHVPTTIWQLQWTMHIPSAPSATVTYLGVDVAPAGGSTIVKLRVFYDLGTNKIVLSGLDSAGSIVSTSSADPPVYGESFLWAITSFTSGGGTVAYAFSQYSATGVFVQQAAISDTGESGRFKTFKAQATAGNVGWSFGHAGLFIDPAILTAPNIGPNAKAMSGHAGEMAHERAIRLCREERIPFYNTSATSAAMGPQPVGKLVDLLRECEAADMGVLYEHEFGLGYQSLDDRLNAPVQLALDFDAGHIGETPEPADDDQRLTNRVTATRTGGSSATVEDADSIAVHGLFESSAPVNVEADAQTGDVAGWRVHVGTVEEDRWPSLASRLDANPGLIPTWTALPFGARMTVANPPDEMPPDTLDLIVEGWSERLDQFTWTADLNLSPASPYRVGVVSEDVGDAGEFVGRLEADSIVLNIDVSAVDTSWQVISVPEWTVDPDDFPMNVRWGGEEIMITSAVDSGSWDTWTVVRSINGVVKPHTTADLIGYQGLTQPLVVVP